MKIVVTTSQSMAGMVEKKTQTINISPFDTTPKALIDAKGDLLVGLSAGVLDNLPIGTDGNILIADSAEPLGMSWAPAPSTGGSFECYNNDGVTHAVGTVVIIDPSVDYGVKKTTTAGDYKVFAIAIESVSSASLGDYTDVGRIEVLVQGNVTRGDWLVASSTSGRAASVGVSKPASGGIGIAMTSYAGGGAGSVIALVSIQHFSTAGLQRLATTSTGAGTTSPLTVSHVTDVGTTCVIALLSWNHSSGGGTASSITHNGTSMTLAYNGQLASTGYRGVAIGWLNTPAIGTYNVVATVSGSVNTVKMAVLNFASTQATPVRTATAADANPGTSLAVSPSSSVGDIVLGVAAIDTTSAWSYGGGETLIYQHNATSAQHLSTSKAGAAGTTTLTYTGASAYGRIAGIAVSGS